MGLTVQEFKQLPDPPVVELGIEIVEKKQRIFASCRAVHGDVRELKNEQCASLLTGGSELAKIAPVEKDLKIVTMRTDERMAGDGFGLHPDLQPFRDQAFVIGQVAFSVEL